MKRQKLGMVNTYTIYKYEEGEKKVLAHFHNLITSKMKLLLVSYGGTAIHSVWFGDGNKEPSESDTALTHALWVYSWNDKNVVSIEKPTISEDGTWDIFFTAKIDAKSEFVGTVSELGIYIRYGSSNMVLGTHALIKDAEGNPMTITKADTEVLFVDVHIQYQLSGSSEFEWNKYYQYLLCNTSNFLVSIPCLDYMEIAMLRTYPDLMSNGNIMGKRVFLTQSYNEKTHVLTCSNGRFGTDNQSTQDYVNAIGLLPAYGANTNNDSSRTNIPIGVWKFPNPDLFPNTTLTDMQVGIGDGETTDFIPPLNLWVKDTERIYINGVLQVRDVDYTCDHRNNLSDLESLRPSMFCKLKNEVVRLDQHESGNMGCHPLKGGYNAVSGGSYRRVYILWDKDHPLEWELEPDPQIGIEADSFEMISMYHNAGNYQYWRNAIFTLSYSKDGEEWTDVESFTETKPNAIESHMFEFPETIAAKHWRLNVDVSGCSEEIRNARFFTNYTWPMRRKGSPISFMNPPAKGAVITMEADIDRPMKNDKFVLDINPTFTV